MNNYCFLLVFKDTLFRQILSNLLSEMNYGFEVFESTSNGVDELLMEVLSLNPDTVLLEEASPMSTSSCLFQLIKAMPGRPVVVVSREYNRMHVLHWRTVQVETVNDLIESIKQT